jgi:serine/threonine protein kinase
MDGYAVVRQLDREAQVLASLNHPNIAAIHGLEEADGVRALVMELVEGPTLADRMAQGSIPLDEALPIARQIAEALEYSHEKGIIHRDLKPTNVKLTAEGVVKVLDFGLAKALEEGMAANDPEPRSRLWRGCRRCSLARPSPAWRVKR